MFIIISSIIIMSLNRISSSNPDISSTAIDVTVNNLTINGTANIRSPGIPLPPFNITDNVTLTANSYFSTIVVPNNMTVTSIIYNVVSGHGPGVNTRFCIYRGARLTPSAALVGQSAILDVDTDGFITVPIVAESGQNLTFAAGDLLMFGFTRNAALTIRGFITAGVGVISYDFVSSTIFTGGFPASPASISGLAPSTQRVGITLLGN